jgi:hypothetical protein
VVANRYPGYSIVDFDRNRDGVFLAQGSGWGLFDLSTAILQFTHDDEDLDGDGVTGFYELECRNAAQGIELDPNEAQTSVGQNDGAVDCDGDGRSNAFEISEGLNPLDPNDIDGDVDNDGTSNIDEVTAGTFTPAAMRLKVFSPTAPDLQGLVGVAVIIDQPDRGQAPDGTTIVLHFDPAMVSFHSADWSPEYKQFDDPAPVAQPTLYQFGPGGCAREDEGPAECVTLRNPQHRKWASNSGRGGIPAAPEGESRGRFALFYFQPVQTGRTFIGIKEADTVMVPQAAQNALTYGLGGTGKYVKVEVQQ